MMARAARHERSERGSVIEGGGALKGGCDWVGLCVRGEEYDSQPARWSEPNRA